MKHLWLVIVGAIVVFGFATSFYNAGKYRAESRARRDSIKTLVERVDSVLVAADEKDSVIVEQQRETEAVAEQHEVAARTSGRVVDSVFVTLGDAVPDTLRPMLDSLQVAHNSQVDELEQRNAATIILLGLERQRVINRDSTIVMLNAANARLLTAFNDAEKRANPSWFKKGTKALPAIAAGMIVGFLISQ